MGATSRIMQFLGVRYRAVSDGQELLLLCPLCGREKLYINEYTALWHCKYCDRSGNLQRFLRIFYDYLCFLDTEGLEKMSKERGINSETLLSVGIKRYSGGWVLPCYDKNSQISSLRVTKGNGTRWMNLPDMPLTVWGLHLDTGQHEVYLCEGEWDAFALLDMGLNLEESCVYAVPGASVWKKEWSSLLEGRLVYALYDADAAGQRGLKRLCQLLPLTGFLNWDIVSQRIDVREGMDVRDLYIAGWSYDDLRRCISPIQGDDKPSDEPQTLLGVHSGAENWDDVERALSSYYEMDRSHREILSIACSQLISLSLQRRDPLWVFYVGASGSGKSEILRLLSTHPSVRVLSNLTAHSLVSGWKGSDASLLPKLQNKLVIFKDFTEILTLSSQEMEQILSTLRGAYDGYVRREFGNNVTREYKDVYFAVASATTSVVDRLTDAALGERSLKYRVRLPYSFQKRETKRAIYLSETSNTEIENLRQQVAAWLLSHEEDLKRLAQEPLTEEDVERLTSLGFVVSIGRATAWRDMRRRIVSLPETEIPTRISVQMAKLFRCLRSLNRIQGNRSSVWETVERVCVDSCNPLVWRALVGLLKGIKTVSELSSVYGVPEENLTEVLENLVLIGVVSSKREEGAFERFWYIKEPPISGLWEEVLRLESLYTGSLGQLFTGED